MSVSSLAALASFGRVIRRELCPVRGRRWPYSGEHNAESFHRHRAAHRGDRRRLALDLEVTYRAITRRHRRRSARIQILLSDHDDDHREHRHIVVAVAIPTMIQMPACSRE
jgi:hypothetical protein